MAGSEWFTMSFATFRRCRDPEKPMSVDDTARTQASVDALRAADPTLGRLIDSLEPVDLASWRARWSLDHFGSLARAIVGQQIATRAAAAIFGRLQAFIGDRDPASAVAGASDTE